LALKTEPMSDSFSLASPAYCAEVISDRRCAPVEQQGSPRQSNRLLPVGSNDAGRPAELVAGIGPNQPFDEYASRACQLCSKLFDINQWRFFSSDSWSAAAPAAVLDTFDEAAIQRAASSSMPFVIAEVGGGSCGQVTALSGRQTRADLWAGFHGVCQASGQGIATGVPDQPKQKLPGIL